MCISQDYIIYVRLDSKTSFNSNNGLAVLVLGSSDVF